MGDLIFQCSACNSRLEVGKALNTKRHPSTKKASVGAFSCSEYLPSHASSERSGVVVKSTPPIENGDGGWMLGMRILRLAFQARKGYAVSFER